MKTPATTDAARSPLQNLMLGMPLAESVGADFKRGTWTFKISPAHRVAAGRYALVPVDAANRALDQEADAHTSLTGAIALSLPNGERSVRFTGVTDESALLIEVGGKDVTRLYREHRRPLHASKKWHPARWHGVQTRIDSMGNEWDMHCAYVQNDFGDLVQVAA